jgi:hypothetical protein
MIAVYALQKSYKAVLNMDAWEIIAERKILEAMESGAFENLEGAGQPVNSDEPELEPSELRMAHRLLRNQGFTLSWIEELNELRTARQQLCCEVDSYVKQSRSPSGEAGHVRSECALRDRTLEHLRQKVQTLNHRITTYNLNAPSVQFHLGQLELPPELTTAA